MKYKINDLEIDITISHTLPQYQRQYPLYDRFLPHLAIFLDGVVVDVGANVGALMAAMASNNPYLDFVCIEPDETFFSYLVENAKLFPERVTCLQYKVGMDDTQLDTIIGDEKVALIKVDVDGYDWDVLNSYGYAQTPPLFFEMDFQNEDQLKKYIACLLDLKGIGYKHFYLFDNFGEYVTYTSVISVIERLNEYVWRMKKGGTHTTVYYFDVLACMEKDADNINNAIDEYVRKR